MSESPMWMWLLISAHADPVDLARWEEVRPVDDPAAGQLSSGEVFVRTVAGCLPGQLSRTPELQVELEVCEQPTSAGGTVTCNQHGVGIEGWEANLVCSWTQADGSDGGGWGTGSGFSAHGQPTLVELDAGHAVWRGIVEFYSELVDPVWLQHPCSEESLEALGADAPEDGRQACVTSSGVRQMMSMKGVANGMPAGFGFVPTPVDCRVPCPHNPDLARLESDQDALEGKRFALRTGQSIGLFRTRAACEAYERGAPLQLAHPGAAACTPDDPPWAVQEPTNP